jgi:1-acyl-sn-glycerol-3-phosphate acyltransferase
MTRFSKGYAFVRTFFVGPGFRLFYRRIWVAGRPSPKGAVVFAPNHQNALMDAICILCTCNCQPVFVARADIFRSRRILIRILHFLRILPIYRRRDGVDTSENNRDTFDVLLATLHSGRAVGIMPEGAYSKLKRLQPLQKGIFRIAMKAQETYGDKPCVKIIPVGLEYSDIRQFRSEVMIRYGEAIELSDYYGLYAEQPARALKQLQDILTERMKKGMIHIENDTYYNEIDCARRFFEPDLIELLGLHNDAEGKLAAQQRVVAALEEMAARRPDKMAVLSADIRQYTAWLAERRLCDRTVRQPCSRAVLLRNGLLLAAGLPLWVVAMALNYPPYLLAKKISRMPKDPQFTSSVHYVGTIAFFPLYHLMLAVLFFLFVPGVPWKIGLSLLPAPAGLFALTWQRAFTQWADCRRFRQQPINRRAVLSSSRRMILEQFATGI